MATFSQVHSIKKFKAEIHKKLNKMDFIFAWGPIGEMAGILAIESIS